MKAKLITSLTLILALTAFGCRPTVKGRSLEELTSPANFQESYRARRGDVLFVKVWGEPQLSGEVQVRSDGKFTMSLVNDVDAEGRTLEQIKADVTNMLSKFIPSVSLSISLARSAPIRYYLSGMIMKPGGYASDGPITLLQAVATGGGFQPFADETQITLVRKVGEEEFRYVLNYHKVIDGKEPNPELRDGDVIDVR